ncbi:AraC family transcriptional regulator [Paenibacillus hodogayensis]|uniref:AraC family transcriptional regulator n=1 Tax=Paenibacillus hodogayensis TaxID=279208 RepID=A0ABV5W625_9BACL
MGKEEGNRIHQIRPYVLDDAILTNLPLRLYKIGISKQKKIIRLEGFPVPHLFINRSGGGRFQNLHTGKEWTLGDNEACILPAHVPHTYYPHPDTVWMHGFITMTGPAIGSLLDMMKVPLMETIPLRSTKTIWVLFDNMYQLVRQNAPEHEWSVSVLLYELLLEVLKQSALRTDREAPGEAKNGAAAVRMAAKMIREHYAEPILLAECAQSLGYTVQHLNRLFRQAYGMTMHKYLEDFRFEKSLHLLGLDMSIQDTASALGMEANYFIRAFKRIHGMTPGEYKARQAAE